ncbi:hypothetical protein [Streptomyces orinoci]|uniref:Uncharacterized protein n=1 Tax=Streptomyces orinoci TaxID=67339 RepID=A0ABV3JXZ5_STRON|nr:hypothetical protein [Streptomyces orinoci]
MTSAILPPPPPPPGLRSWPDRSALLADRARALRTLTHSALSPRRLALSAMLTSGYVLAWVSFAYATGWPHLAFGAALLAACAVPTWFTLRRERYLRHLATAWATLDPDPASVPQWRAPARALTWLAYALALIVLALALLTTPLTGTASPVPLGIAAILLAAGAHGLAQVLGYRRLLRAERA